LLLEKKNFFRSIFAMLRYLLGGKPRMVRHLRARKLDLVSPIAEPTDVDGQPGVAFPLHIECLPGAVRVRQPRRS
ncbi:MAG: lipid kinase, partial [Alistipes sp.]|nr:lipid kinase [Alistipes sp.]